jgi:hypothetical protein
VPVDPLTGAASGGQIPFRVWVGVVGHRRFDDEEAVARRARAAFGEVRTLFGTPRATDVVFTIVSPLAEGADRLLVREGFAELSDDGVELMAVLPLPEDDYRTDFESDRSRAEFDELLAGASAVVPPPDPTDREDAYSRAGREVVNRSDVLVVVWDDEDARGRGGTAEVVHYARARGVPRFVVPVAAEAGVDEGARFEPSPHVERTRSVLQRFDDYNGRPADDRLAASIERERSKLRAYSRDPAIHRAVERVADWALPQLARADVLALRYQRLYHYLGDAVFALSALAVAAVALQTSFTPHRPIVALTEVAFLLLLLGFVRYARRGHMHDNWIGCRSLAESFRSALFIVMTEDADNRETTPASSTESGELWFRRAFTEAWRWRPTLELDEATAPALRSFLTEAWIEDQIRYHTDHVAERSRRRHRVVVAVIAGLFAAALMVALLHALRVGEEKEWLRDLLIFLAIALPGFGAAATGHREQRQYRLHRQRSIQMAARLEPIKAELAVATDFRTIQRLAREAHGVIVEENLDWYGVVELQDLEMVM